MDTAKEKPLPKKRDVATAVLEHSSLFIHLDPRRAGVKTPAKFVPRAQLVLQVGYKMAIPIPDLRVDDDGIRGTLLFNRAPFLCVLPWSSIYALVGEDGKGMVWPDDVPIEVRDQMQGAEGASPREAHHDISRPPAGLRDFSIELAGCVSGAVARAPTRAVLAVDGRRLVLDLRTGTFGARFSIALGADVEDGGESSQRGPYRGGPPWLRAVPRLVMRPRTSMGRLLALLGIVRDIHVPQADFRQLVSVRSDDHPDRVRASLASFTVRDAALSILDLGFDEVGLRKEGAVVIASVRHPGVRHAEIDRLWGVCQSMQQIHGAFEDPSVT